MALRTLTRFRNPDLTSDLNHRLRDLISPGIFYGGQVSPVAGSLQVDVQPFAAIGADGMVTILEGAAERVSVQANNTNIIVVHAKYVANNSPIAVVESLTQAQWDALSGAEQGERLRFATITLPTGVTEVSTSQIDVRDADRIDTQGRGLIRGSVDVKEDLPDYSFPPTGVTTQNRINDIWYVTLERVFYVWVEESSVEQWKAVISSAAESELLNHRKNLDDGTTPIEFIEAQHVLVKHRESFDEGVPGFPLYGAGNVNDFGAGNAIVDAKFPTVVRMPQIFTTGPYTQVQLVGKVYVGSGAIGTAKDYITLSSTIEDINLLGSDNKPITIFQVQDKDTFIQINPSTDADVFGFVEDPLVVLDLTQTADIDAAALSVWYFTMKGIGEVTTSDIVEGHTDGFIPRVDEIYTRSIAGSEVRLDPIYSLASGHLQDALAFLLNEINKRLGVTGGLIQHPTDTGLILQVTGNDGSSPGITLQVDGGSDTGDSGGAGDGASAIEANGGDAGTNSASVTGGHGLSGQGGSGDEGTGGRGVYGTGGTSKGIGTSAGSGVYGQGGDYDDVTGPAGYGGAGVYGIGGKGSSSSNHGPGVEGVGYPSGGGSPGIKGTGVGNNPGVEGTGGSDANGVTGYGDGTGYGVFGDAAQGSGVYGRSDNGVGVEGRGSTTSGNQAGVKGTGGVSNGSGVEGTGGASDGSGVEGYGKGTGSGVYGTNATGSGPGVKGVGGAASSSGVEGSATVGHGIVGSGNSNSTSFRAVPQSPSGITYASGDFLVRDDDGKLAYHDGQNLIRSVGLLDVQGPETLNNKSTGRHNFPGSLITVPNEVIRVGTLIRLCAGGELISPGMTGIEIGFEVNTSTLLTNHSAVGSSYPTPANANWHIDATAVITAVHATTGSIEVTGMAGWEQNTLIDVMPHRVIPDGNSVSGYDTTVDLVFSPWVQFTGAVMDLRLRLFTVELF